MYGIWFLVFSILFSSHGKATEELFTSSQKEALKKIVEEHLMDNPEVLGSALQKLQEKKAKAQIEKTKQLVQKHEAQLFKAPDDYVLGPEKASTSLVVFMDPYCGHCRQLDNVLKQALDPKNSSGIKDLKVIIKDFPIFGEPSEVAVKAMLAAKNQGKYEALQQEIFKTEAPLKKDQILKIAKDLGIEEARLIKDMEGNKIQEMISKTRQLAGELGIGGTPALVIGDMLIPGALTLEDLNELVSHAKKPKGEI